MTKATPDIGALAVKHGITEDAVRDILGLEAVPVASVTAKVDAKNPAKVTFDISDYEGDVILDVGGSGFITVPIKNGKVVHVFPFPGLKRVRVDMGGVVRYLDVEVGVDPEPEVEDEPEAELPIGAPDFSQTLMEPQEPSEEALAAADAPREPIAELDPLAKTKPESPDTTRDAKVGKPA